MTTSSEVHLPGSPVPPPSRRRFLALLAGGLLATLAPGSAHAAGVRRRLRLPFQGEHPDPRPGVDASKVLTAEQLHGAPHLVRIFDGVREIPHIVDGIRCHCGCAGLEGYRSLLSCYEGIGMAQHCEICQGEGRLAYARWKEGQTLDQIRRAIDARFGHGGPPAGDEHHAHAHHRS